MYSCELIPSTACLQEFNVEKDFEVKNKYQKALSLYSVRGAAWLASMERHAREAQKYIRLLDAFVLQCYVVPMHFID